MITLNTLNAYLISFPNVVYAKPSDATPIKCSENILWIFGILPHPNTTLEKYDSQAQGEMGLNTLRRVPEDCDPLPEAHIVRSYFQSIGYSCQKVDVEMHKEDLQAASGQSSLGPTGEERVDPQLNRIPQQQGTDEGTKNIFIDLNFSGTFSQDSNKVHLNVLDDKGNLWLKNTPKLPETKTKGVHAEAFSPTGLEELYGEVGCAVLRSGIPKR
ncbi:hypothetical protein Tco_0940291 [Tanacetum coccineum]|uniref:Uncharacterized protein n=1 Tax=Tanacetum coccineum TaxID=301880 RepID=A0ABQ5DQ95_9ASTR